MSGTKFPIRGRVTLYNLSQKATENSLQTFTFGTIKTYTPMTTRKQKLDEFHESALSLTQLKYVRGGGDTVPPQGDPGDMNDPNNPTPPSKRGYIDPNPDNPTNP